jgi:HTH-type transcriptional regulator, transcriptional repressor of NAD biosynthesis genes
MSRGLVIGKFLPVHNGHVALIRFAAAQCDELIVSMSSRSDDPIDADLRFSWLNEIFANERKIIIRRITDDFDDDSLPWPERTKIWADVIRKVYPPFDIIVSSEKYADYFADNLGVRSIQFDPGRVRVPVSATLIRNKPLQYWDFIPASVRPYFLKKVCFYGPESTGKSLMAERMADKYQTVFVPEVAREFLITNDFSADDIIQIGLAHRDRIAQKSKEANRILFVDTDAITTKIYSQHYLGKVPLILDQMEADVVYDHYFLFDIDVPWVSDGLRDLGHCREEMLDIFKQNLEMRKIKYTLVSGDWSKRELVIDEKLRTEFGL